ncbi:MAG: NAD(P)/FAD-dependent oxidoreductase [Lachnospiraceae bacterium]|nr:NAD(P)/FAD-dependent oxidoreductase [Lachnospiraceae bacterium]
MYDAVIIGSGPAGLSAAINLKLHEKDFIWFGSRDYSDKVEKSEKIANYPGLGLIPGAELNARFDAHAKEMGLEPVDKKVTNVMPADGYLMVLAENEVYETKTLLLATGVLTAKSYEGEDELLGRGVSYCATCDGFLYKGKTIAVFCGAPRYEHEVEYLAGIAEKVYLSAGYPNCGVDLPNVEKIAPVRAVQGSMKVAQIVLHDGTEIPVDGLFILRNAVAPGTLVPGLATDGPHIVVDRKQATNVPGVYAAGDCTGRPYQITKAVGEGNVAAHEMLDYMAK